MIYFKRWLRRVLWARRVVVWREEPMTEEELRTVFTGWEWDRRLQAVMQVLQEEIDDAASEVGAMGLLRDGGLPLAHTAGGLERLQVLAGVLEDLRNARARRRFKPSAYARTEDREEKE